MVYTCLWDMLDIDMFLWSVLVCGTCWILTCSYGTCLWDMLDIDMFLWSILVCGTCWILTCSYGLYLFVGHVGY